ncbi:MULTISPECIES: TfuA-like protein [unclassified Mesorhizobium]|uniref:TfuA-like protein n=1 Tax=unclassified Mesorhizobium TaxID=325217 RepID=UPI000BB09E98|nr:MULTISPECIES: TfuA-like protein [unclassified Mesorhizobium]PBC21270.1 TfuA-like core domain-containing protein [Mesorhizobium sp. WSM4311]TRD04801.1 TfuA-like core domain-containing protein [Mesorhizobium sp. WSM4305]
MKPIVFAGPSLHGLQLPSESRVEFAPPAGCGDLLRAAREGRGVIGLIDGTFESGPAVWHKEILFALASGCTVLGASSMGAIRAAECAAFGMIGIGQVFEDFLAGRRSADADVALIHGPMELGYVPLSVALVDVEDAVARMHAARELSDTLRDEIVGQARAMFFKSRTWPSLLSAAGADTGCSQRITRWIASNGPGLKARDAQLLLEALPGTGRRDDRIDTAFLETRFFSKLIAGMGDG